MKRILVYFDEKEFESLLANKGKLSWHDFILSECAYKYILKRDIE